MRGMTTVVTALAAALLLATPGVHAQTCGDPDGSGIDVIDAANVLRAAVGLPSNCSAVPAACDVDANHDIDVVDAANVLRAAVNLPARLGCAAPGITRFVTSVEDASGTSAQLTLGIAPIPQAGAPATIGDITGATTVKEGGSNTLTVTFDTAGAAAASAAAAAPGDAAASAAGDPTLLIAVQTGAGVPVDGFFMLPLTGATGEVTIVTMFGDRIPTHTFMFELATSDQGIVSQYAPFLQVVATPTPRKTPQGNPSPPD
jgi:hypothetical protein